MDCWVHDESLFISRKLGSPEGVVQVYKCWSLDTPLGHDSFSLLGETGSPSEIAPATVWGKRDYLRLIEFLEVNSAMINLRGHVILRSQMKSRRVGRPDGPETYWRCLDVLPVHAFGLERPADTHGTPQFLITGGDVVSTNPGKVIIDKGDDKLEAELKQLKYELAATLKDTLGGVNHTLTDGQSENNNLVKEIEDQESASKQILATLKDVESERDSVKANLFNTLSENKKLVKEIEDQESASKQILATLKDVESELDSAKASLCDTLTENKKLVKEIEDQESANKIIQATLKDVEVERDSVKASLVALADTLTACQTENKNLVREIEDQKFANKQILASQKDVEVEGESVKASLVALGSTLTACQTENNNLVKEIEDQRSANKELEVRLRDVEGERQKASQEAEKLKIQVSESVSKSVLTDSLEKERDRWASFAAYESLTGWTVNLDPSYVYCPVNELPGNTNGRGIDLSNYHKVFDFYLAGNWTVYRNGNKVTLACNRVDPTKDLRLNRQKLQWEKENKTGRLHGSIEMFTTFYK